MESFTVTFAQVGELALEATVFPASSSQTPSPTLLYFHSGGLTGGARLGFSPAWLADLAREHGCHLVTFDYRLFPTVSLAELEEDLVKAYEYTRDGLSNELVAKGFSPVDASRTVVTGASAGVWCAAMLTLHLTETGTPPTAFIGLYGETNLGGAYYNTPKPAGEEHAWSARQSVASLKHLFEPGRPYCLATDTKWFSSTLEDLKTEGDRQAFDQATLTINLFYDGVLADVFTGIDGLSARLAAHPTITTDLDLQRETIPASAQRIFPLLRLSSRFPRTLLFHGEEDFIVPISDSEVFHAELVKASVQSRFVRVPGPGSGHGFDRQNVEHWLANFLCEPIEELFASLS